MPARRPSGLKLYPKLLDNSDVEAILAHCDRLPPPPFNPLFRYFGAFDGLDRTEPQQPWMVDIGRRLQSLGLFDKAPNQYRVTHWHGELAAQFKWHIDNRRHGDELAVVSLTDGRCIGFRDKARPREVYKLSLSAGDVYRMTGAARWKWEHRVMPVGRGRSGGRSFVVAWRAGTGDDRPHRGCTDGRSAR